MIETTKDNIEFYSDGYKTRVICNIHDGNDYMFQTADDRYLERYWNWENQFDRHEMRLTSDETDNSTWRKLNVEGPDLSIIRNCIAALNYNANHSKIDNSIKNEIACIIEKTRDVWSSIEYELIPDPIPMPQNSDITNQLEFNCIRKYGVTLKRLTHDKIELVRRWRNDPKISKFMEYRDEITPEMQENWFRKIDDVNNFYFIIEYRDKEIGLINVRDVDYEKKEGEPGIFIWDDECLNSTISFAAALSLTDFCFDTLGLTELVIHVLKDNKRAIQFNKAYGYILSENQDDVYNQEYRMNYNAYVKKRNRIIKLLH